jgi:outer membrane protein assembly factor BamB
MLRRIAWVGGLLLGIGFLVWVQRAHAFIKAEDYPLKKAIDVVPYIFVAKVDKFDPDKKTSVLVVGESFGKKDKPPFAKLPVSFSRPSDEGADEGHVAKMMKRLADDLPVVVFVSKESKEADSPYRAMVYTNGTWFHMINPDPAKQPAWRFLHCEVFLRGTFKGTTEEMRQVIGDYLTKKKEPPAVNSKEPAGLGPEVPAKPRTQTRVTEGPVFAVIPTVAIGGPLAILSMLFPTLFGKPKEIMKRYLALLTVASINSIVYLVCLYFEWPSLPILFAFMTVVTALGIIWAWRRYRDLPDAPSAVVSFDPKDESYSAKPVTFAESMVPKRGEMIALQVLSLVCLALAPYLLGIGLLFKDGGREVLMLAGVVWSGTLGALYLRHAAGRSPDVKPAFPLEGIMLTGLALVCGWMTLLLLPSSATGESTPTDNGIVAIRQPAGPEASANSIQPQLLGVAWTFPHKGTGTMDSTPLVTDKHVYIAVKIAGAFGNSGRLYCLERPTGKVLWKFDNDGELKAVFSTPYLADGKLYIGEGYHQDRRCKLFCLDAATGSKLWEFKTKSHTESSPTVANGKVYIGAGDDGLYCLNAQTGEPVWNYPDVHVDAAPAVAGNRVFCGSGVGDIHKDTAIFCLNSDTGKQIWRMPMELPVWGSPAVDGDSVFYGIGNGNFLEDADKPAGALLCVKAETGQRIWSYTVPNGILARPAVDQQMVYFACRDKHCYAIDRTDGKLRWKKNLGSPVVAAPALAGGCPHCGSGQSLYAVASGGQVFCLDSVSGNVAWQFDVAKHSGKKPQLFSSPKVAIAQSGKEERRRIYFGTGLDTLAEWHATLYCLEDRLPGGAASKVAAEGHAKAAEVTTKR